MSSIWTVVILPGLQSKAANKLSEADLLEVLISKRAEPKAKAKPKAKPKAVAKADPAAVAPAAGVSAE